jgi:hypothetical protein
MDEEQLIVTDLKEVFHVMNVMVGAGHVVSLTTSDDHEVVLVNFHCMSIEDDERAHGDVPMLMNLATAQMLVGMLTETLTQMALQAVMPNRHEPSKDDL